MRSQALEDLFVQELEELYDAEKQIHKGLGVMAKGASNAGLRSEFQDHRKQTQKQIERLEASFGILGEKPSGSGASGVSGLIKRTKEQLARAGSESEVGDAGLIANAQKLEHYEIAGYGCARAHAGLLGYREIEELLAETLKEEEAMDRALTSIAENSVNRTAAGAPYAHARTGLRHEAIALGDTAAEGGISLGKLAMGVAIGGALSVLFAPRAGSETRDRIVSALTARNR